MMNKEDVFVINLALVITYFIANILFILCDTNYYEVIIVETFTTPFLYLLFYIILKLV